MWATRQGSIWDPASLHRYNYARANPVNYIDPSGRSNLMEIALNASNKFAQGVVLAALGHEMNCLYGAEASMLDVIVMGPLASREQMQILSAHMDVANCSAQITGRQLLMGGLFNVGLGWALEAPGMLLEEGAQGMGWRLLTEEEGGIGPAQRIIQGPEIPANDWQSYEQGVRDLFGGDQSFKARQFSALVNGNEVNGVSDAITTIDGQQAAVDAKYVDWDQSIYNPNGPVMDQPWGINAVDQMIKQAQAYGNAFPGGVTYFTNSPELAEYYTQAFSEAGVTNFQFVIAPATR